MAKIDLSQRLKLKAHFDGKLFRNFVHDHSARGLKEVLKWRFTAKRPVWPRVTEAVPGLAPLKQVAGAALRVTFVNHATVLIQTQGLNLLTDPIWSHRSSPFSWIGPKRFHPAGIRMEDLPPIDAVFVSHDHYDHFDVPTLKLLAANPRTKFYSGLGAAELFANAGLKGRMHEMDWWESNQVFPDLKVTYVPTQHFSGRSLWDRYERLWGGFALQFPAGNVYFCGDSGYCGHFSEAAERFGDFRLAILPLGAYEPRWFMKHMHMDPSDSLQAFHDLKARFAMGIHYGTFQLTDEAHDAPHRDLAEALRNKGLDPGAFRMLGFGEHWDIPESAAGHGT